MCIRHRESKKCKNIARAKGLFWENLKLLYFLKEFTTGYVDATEENYSLDRPAKVESMGEKE